MDIADALGCSRKNLTEITKNNPHLFKGVSITSTLQTDGGPQKAVCLTRDGVIGILMRVHPSGSKTEDGKRKIEQFHIWARDTLSGTRILQAQAPALPASRHQAWADTASEHIKFARTISRELGMPENLCLAVAIQQAEKETGINLSQYRKLIAPVQASIEPQPQAPGGPAAKDQQPDQDYLTVTQIAGIVRLRAEEINRYLENQGYQFRDPVTKEFRPTGKGSQYGRLFPFCAQSGHTGYVMKWTRAIIRESKMLENRPARIKD